MLCIVHCFCEKKKGRISLKTSFLNFPVTSFTKFSPLYSALFHLYYKILPSKQLISTLCSIWSVLMLRVSYVSEHISLHNQGLISRGTEHPCHQRRSTAQICLVLLLNWLKFHSYTGSRFRYYRPVFRVRWYPRHFGFGWRGSTRLFTHKWPLHYRAKSWIEEHKNVLLIRRTFAMFNLDFSFFKMNLPSLGIMGIFFLKSVLFHLAT